MKTYYYYGSNRTVEELLQLAHENYHNPELKRPTLAKRLDAKWPVRAALETKPGAGRPASLRIRTTKSAAKSQPIKKETPARRANELRYRQAHPEQVKKNETRSKLQVWIRKYSTPEKLDEVENLAKQRLQQLSK